MNIYKLWSVSHFLRSKIISPQWFFSKPSCSKSVWRNCQKTEEKIVQKHENISIDKKKRGGYNRVSAENPKKREILQKLE